MEIEADSLELLLPARTRCDALALHQPPELCAAADEPKPPRATCVLAIALDPARGGAVLPTLEPERP
jgi:hypothetical protein